MTKDLHADTVVIGGGAAVAAVAARLVQGTSQTVYLLESGTDYGAFSEKRWPAQLLDARSPPGDYDWGYPGMTRLAIIADDLSSATDCGAQMIQSGLSVVMPLGGYDT
jgi:choline dehydrogenase